MCEPEIISSYELIYSMKSVSLWRYNHSSYSELFFCKKQKKVCNGCGAKTNYNREFEVGSTASLHDQGCQDCKEIVTECKECNLFSHQLSFSV